MRDGPGCWYGYWRNFLRGIHHHRILLEDEQSLFEEESRNRRWLTRYLSSCRSLPSLGRRGWQPSFTRVFRLIIEGFLSLWESILSVWHFLRVLKLLPSIITSFSTLLPHPQRDFFISSIISAPTPHLPTLFYAFLFFFFCCGASFQDPCDRLR